MLAPLLLALLHGAVAHAPDERMDFAIEHRGITMGKATLSVGKLDGRLLPVHLEARTTGLASVYRFREQLTTYLDVDTGLPRVASVAAVEGNYRRVRTTAFHRDVNQAIVRRQGKYDRTFRVDVPPGALDFVALVFRLRSLALPVGARHTFHVVSGRAVSTVVAEVVGRETIATDAGTFPAVKVRVPTGFDGEFSEKNPTHVWLSDDGRRVVVRISTDFAIGPTTARLVTYDPGRRAP